MQQTLLLLLFTKCKQEYGSHKVVSHLTINVAKQHPTMLMLNFLKEIKSSLLKGLNKSGSRKSYKIAQSSLSPKK